MRSMALPGNPARPCCRPEATARRGLSLPVTVFLRATRARGAAGVAGAESSKPRLASRTGASKTQPRPPDRPSRDRRLSLHGIVFQFAQALLEVDRVVQSVADAKN